MDRQTKWDLRYLDLARHVGSWSKDPSTKTGAVIVHPRFGVVACGFNGLPVGVDDLEARLNDREVKYKMIVHAERNAIAFARTDLTGCVIYMHPWMPCAPCAGTIIQAGIRRCVSFYNDASRWASDFALTRTMFDEAGVRLDLYPPCEEPK